MWTIEVFDKNTDEFYGNHKLHGLDTDTVIDLLNIDETDHPAEEASHPVAVAELPLFDAYLREPLALDNDCIYFISMLAD